MRGVVEKIVEIFGRGAAIPNGLIKYLFCSPSLDMVLRCLPSSGGLYAQRYRDFLEFNIIEGRIRNFRARGL